MDEELRRLERGDDRLAYATALRRAGDEVRARRVVEDRVRAGDASAREVLDAWWPIDERVVRVISRAMQPDQLRARALFWLFAEEDPRLAPGIDRLVSHWSERVSRHPSTDHRRVAELVALHGRPFEERRQFALANGSVMRLSRARLDADEAASLLARVAHVDTSSRDVRRSLLVSAIWHVGQARARQCTSVLTRHAAEDERVIAFEAARALLKCGVEVPEPSPALLAGLPFAPSWTVDRSPGETRDEQTRAFDRGAFTNDPFAPLESHEGRQAPVDGWLLALAGPKAGMVATRLTRALHASVGDRVASWGHGEWLIRLEPDLDPRAIADGLRAVTGVPVSIGIARGTTWEATISAASTARDAAEREGGDRVRLAE